MTNNQVRQTVRLIDNKNAIESLASRFTAQEISAAEGGATNAYSTALAALTAERQEILDMDISQF